MESPANPGQFNLPIGLLATLSHSYSEGTAARGAVKYALLLQREGQSNVGSTCVSREWCGHVSRCVALLPSHYPKSACEASGGRFRISSVTIL